MQSTKTLHNFKIVADTSSLEGKLTDDQFEYFTKFVVPTGIKILSDRLKVNTTGTLPAFGNNISGCGGSYINVDSKYENQQTDDADFILFLGGNNTGAGTIAFAAPCLIGNFFSTFWNILEIFRKKFQFLNLFFRKI